MVSLYQAQKKIYPRSVSGLFSRWRWALVFLTQIVFYGLPWLEWGQRQAVLLRYYQGMKVDDVAQALRTTRSGVKHRLKQANKLLRTQLEGWYYDEE